MLPPDVLAAGRRRAEVALGERSRAFAAEIGRTWANVANRGVIHSTIAQQLLGQAIRGEFDTRALVLWQVFARVVDPRALAADPEAVRQLKGLLAAILDANSADLVGEHARADQLIPQSGAAGSIDDYRAEALAKVESEIDVEVVAAKGATPRVEKLEAAAVPPAATAGKTVITLFLGSSSAGKSQAKVLLDALSSPDVVFLPWWEAFTPGRTLIEELDGIRGKVDGALLLFAPEYPATIRGKAVEIPNLNVLYEFGYFYGHFGKRMVCMVKYGEFYLPSDLEGYIHIRGSTFFRRGHKVKIGKRTSDDFARWIASI